MGDFQVKKIILPSGKAVEIVYAKPSPPSDRCHAGPLGRKGSRTVPTCAPVLYPIDWHEAGLGKTGARAARPECRWSDRSEYRPEHGRAHDSALNDATEL